MFEIFYVDCGNVHSLSLHSRDTLCNVLMILMNVERVKAVKVFIRDKTGWYQCTDLYFDLGLGFKDWKAFRSGGFLFGDLEV
jgi:hypothetical protein